MPDQNFHRTRLIYQSLQHIAEKKQSILKELVAYTKDPVRYRRRLRFLRELSEYEYKLLKNFEDFQSDDPEKDFDDMTLKKIRESVELMTALNA